MTKAEVGGGGRHEVEFHASGRGKAQCPANPEYPEGIAVIAFEGNGACVAKIPYPAPECGYFAVQCLLCGSSIAVTAAGRADDPVSVRMKCNLPQSRGEA